MKEDILEQLVDDYLQLNGFFTVHNVKFRPSKNCPGYSPKQDCVHSDIDIVGFNPRRSGADQTWVVSCKSWQGGFSPDEWLALIGGNRRVMGRDAWRFFRELANPKWAEALIAKIQDLTGSRRFKYVTAVTKLRGNGSERWCRYALFRKNLRGNPIGIVTLNEIMTRVYPRVTRSNTQASSDVGRLLQVINASEWKP